MLKTKLSLFNIYTMKYLKLYEAFYSPARQIFKANIGIDSQNVVGGNSYPLDSFSVNDEEKAFNEGEKAYNDGIDVNSNPYSDQQYRNNALIKSWNEGWYNGLKNKKIKESIGIDNVTGDIFMPSYLTIDEDDDINIAYEKGREAARQGCDIEENPYTSINDEENNALLSLFYGWEDGFNDIM